MSKKKIEVGGKSINLEFFLGGGDYKFILLMMGLKSATSHYACVWCKIHKNKRWDTSFTLDHFDELEDQCFKLDKIIQLQLAAGYQELPETDMNEKILALGSAQQNHSQDRQLLDKANALQELLNSQYLHSGATIAFLCSNFLTQC